MLEEVWRPVIRCREEARKQKLNEDGSLTLRPTVGLAQEDETGVGVTG